MNIDNSINLNQFVMKMKFVYLCISVLLVNSVFAQSDDEIVKLSAKKWQWMSDKNVDSLSALFHSKSDFVHMGGTWGKDREIDIIKGGFIWYKKAEVYSNSVKYFGNTAVLLSDIDLVAVVGGNDAINGFMVTEVYVKEKGVWLLSQLTFSKLARPVKLK